MKRINWSVPREDAAVIRDIAARAIQITTNAGIKATQQDFEMDITAVHANGCPLRLLELAQANSGDFIHDVMGIRKHLNRTTAHLEDFFTPRYSISANEAA